MTQVATRDDQRLRWAAALFTVAVLVHGLDHVRRGLDATGMDVFWLGTAGIVLEVGVVILVYQRSRLAPMVAAVVGLSLAAGYVFVHFLPERSLFSDSFTSGADVSPLSWFAASFEVVAALLLGLAGLAVLRQRGGLVSATEPVDGERSVEEALRDPVPLAMLIGNGLILLVSFIQIAS